VSYVAEWGADCGFLGDGRWRACRPGERWREPHPVRHAASRLRPLLRGRVARARGRRTRRARGVRSEPREARRGRNGGAPGDLVPAPDVRPGTRAGRERARVPARVEIARPRAPARPRPRLGRRGLGEPGHDRPSAHRLPPLLRAGVRGRGGPAIARREAPAAHLSAVRTGGRAEPVRRRARRWRGAADVRAPHSHRARRGRVPPRAAIRTCCW
jgi:hypothetical protein